MRDYIAHMAMAFIATSDAHGECDTSFRAGPPGFVRVIDERTVMYPEYRGNGVMASLGNITENPYVGLLIVDFFHSTVGLHVNGTARIIENDAVTAFAPLLERMAGAASDDQVPEDKKSPRALGGGLGRRGLHPLLQAHPDAPARRPETPSPAAAPGTSSRPRTAIAPGCCALRRATPSP